MKSPGGRYDNWALVSETLAAWWQRHRGRALRLGALFHRLFLIVGYSWVGLRLDLPVISDYLPLKNVLVCLAAVILIGKTLFDTLFYDHYQP